MTPGSHSGSWVDTPRQTRSRQKRSSYACARCRRQKIKCTDNRPCEPCSKRKLICQNDDRAADTVMVTREYLQNLQDAVARDVQGHGESTRDFAAQASGEGQSEARIRSTGKSHENDAQGLVSMAVNDRQEYDESPELTSLTNPLSTESVFVTSPSGRQMYLGVSSNWSFTRRILDMVSKSVQQSTISSDGLIFDGETYPLEDDDSASCATEHSRGASIPAKDFAKHLISIVKFHCCQLYHLYDEDEFLASFDSFYAQPAHTTPNPGDQRLWYIHFLLLLAFGKAFSSKRRKTNQPAGIELFLRALELLPDTIALTKGPIRAVEILTCIALYLHSLDHRIAAYNYIGQAIRLAMSFGMHTEAAQAGASSTGRYREAWRTVLILDREMTAWQGIPPSVADEDAFLPSSSGGISHSRALEMRVNFSQVIAKVNRVIYGPEGKLDHRFLMRTKESLSDIAKFTDTIFQEFPLATENSVGGLSKISAHIHLLYHQCIILATRPLLFVLLKLQLDQSSSNRDAILSSPTMQGLTQICLSSCSQTITILECLQNEDLLETFLVFDLEALSISTTNILISPAISPKPGSDQPLLLQRAYAMFDDIASHGNRIAEMKLFELHKLEQLLAFMPPYEVSFSDTANPAGRASVAGMLAEQPIDRSVIAQGSQADAFRESISAGGDFGGWFSTDQLTELADEIDLDHADWISQLMTPATS